MTTRDELQAIRDDIDAAHNLVTEVLCNARRNIERALVALDAVAVEAEPQPATPVEPKRKRAVVRQRARRGPGQERVMAAWPPEQDHALMAMLQLGRSHKEIAAALGRTPRGVQGRVYELRKAGVIPAKGNGKAALL